MDILPVILWKGRYHRHEVLQHGECQPTGGRWGEDASQACRRIGDKALDTGGEPDDAGVADPLLRRHAHQGHGQPVEGMGGIDDLDRLMGENC